MVALINESLQIPVEQLSEFDTYPGKTFEIITRNNSVENLYIQSAKLNDEPLNSWWFTHKSLVEGGTLVLDMGSQPNKEWGQHYSAIISPPSPR